MRGREQGEGKRRNEKEGEKKRRKRKREKGEEKKRTRREEGKERERRSAGFAATVDHARRSVIAQRVGRGKKREGTAIDFGAGSVGSPRKITGNLEFGQEGV